MIETRHHIRIDFEYPECTRMDWPLYDNDDIEEKLFRCAVNFGAFGMDIFTGNAACGPYLTCWHADPAKAQKGHVCLVSVLEGLGCKVTP